MTTKFGERSLAAENGYLYVAAVDMGATIYDTADLSTIRGAGLAALWIADVAGEWLAGKRVGHALVVGAASEGLFRIDGPISGSLEGLAGELADHFKTNGRLPRSIDATAECPVPYAHLRVVTGYAKGEDVAGRSFAMARAEAMAMARKRQMQGLSLPPFAAAQALNGQYEPCARQRLLPANMFEKIRSAKAPLSLSKSLYERHVFGRKLRQSFYRLELQRSEKFGQHALERMVELMRYTDDFEEIVDQKTLPAALQGVLPVSCENKLAIVYLDGNDFGKKSQAAAENGEEALRQFSQAAETRRRDLLASLLRDLADEEAGDWRLGMWRRFRGDAGQEVARLRFETLLWGGEEMCFVVPGWAALDVVRLIQAHLGQEDFWTIEGTGRLTFGMGVLVCNRKTPIRLARQLAEELANAAKDTDRSANRLQMLVLESVDIPPEGPLPMRRRLLGYGEDEKCTARLREETSFRGEDWAALIRQLHRIKRGPSTNDSKGGKPVPRSQLYDYFRRSLNADDESWHDGFAEIMRRYRTEEENAKTDKAGSASTIPWPLTGLALDDVRAALWHLLQFWDYVDPFELSDAAPSSNAAADHAA